jgi:penicillin-binding protein 1B
VSTPTTRPTASTRASVARKKTKKPRRKRGWKFFVLVGLTGPLLVLGGVCSYYYVQFSRMIDARIHGEMQRVDPRVFARPFALHRGQSLTPHQLVDRLNDIGYSNRPAASDQGEFAIGRDAVLLVPKDGPLKGRQVRVVFGGRRAAPPAKDVKDAKDPKAKEAREKALQNAEPTQIDRFEVIGTTAKENDLTLGAPLITALTPAGRAKRRDVPLAAIPSHMVNAVLAIEDRRFYEHPGIDPIAITGVAFGTILGRREMRGASTLTQQLVKNTFLTQERTLRRKMTEWFMSVVLERQLSKQQILELYLNDVWLGQRGSFAIHGVAEAARLFFGKDISNVSLAEAATIAGVIQSPPRHSPFNNPDKSRERRNVVLHAMAESGFVTGDEADRASREPLQIVARALDAEAPYFVDYISQELQDKYKDAGTVDVYSTLDLHLQRAAQDAIRDGLVTVDAFLAKRQRQRAQAALLAVDPRTGEILALVGGRSYNQSQYDRATSARRQPGSVFKPFVYLAAFEQAKADGRTDISAATVMADEPTTWESNEQEWSPGNYDGEFEGPVTLRRALALSRNIVAIKVAEAAGYDHVAALWRKIGAGTPPRPYPSIALGVFEATPFEIASAYTIFPNAGTIRPLKAIDRLVSGGRDLAVHTEQPRTVTSPDTTFIVTNMLRSVINEGTGAGARAAGFALDAAGKSGTTNDLRDAWFVGFTPELLTVVWVGLDDNQPLGLSGTQAALPIWTTFMMRALAGHQNVQFETPEGVTFVDIDRDTGQLATPTCPRVFTEAFLPGTEPTQVCPLHSFGGTSE